jgi:hypothetical protein
MYSLMSIVSVLNIDTTLAVSDNLLFTSAMEEVPASLPANQLNQFLRLLNNTEEGARLKAVNDQLKEAVELYNLKEIKVKESYT